MSEVKYVICNSCKRKIEAFYHEYSGKIVTQHCLICNNEIKNVQLRTTNRLYIKKFLSYCGCKFFKMFRIRRTINEM